MLFLLKTSDFAISDFGLRIAELGAGLSRAPGTWSGGRLGRH
jgi:hypothetical protein